MRHSNGRKGTVPLQSKQITDPGTTQASKEERLPDGLHYAVYCSRCNTDQGPRIELQLCKNGRRHIRVKPGKLEVEKNRPKPIKSGTNLIVEVKGGRIQKVYPKVSYASPAKRKQAERRRNSRK